jgi:hypothetical protein
MTMAVTTQFDPLFPAELTGTITVEVLDPDGTPNRVLEIDRNWRIVVDWHLVGPFACTLAGTWSARSMVESIGPGFEGQVGPTVNRDLLTQSEADSTPTDCHYHAHIDVPAGTITDVGVYKLVSLITYRDAANNPRPMAGFAEYPLITFYRDQ